MEASRAVLGAADSNDFDYTFTNQELEDVLGFLERKQTGVDLDQGSLPFSGPLSLQFQPRPEASLASLQLAGYEASTAAYPAAPPAAPTLPLMHMQPPAVGGFVQQVPVDGGAEEPLLVEQEPTNFRQQAAAGGWGSAAARRDGKPVMSHSTVEKQRRDRINSLIDELRGLVPPQPQPASAALGAGEGGDQQQPQGQGGGDHGQGKRPKHVVLADTIALVKDLQERLALDEQRIAQLRDHQAHCPFTTLDQQQHQQPQRGRQQEQQQPAGSAGSGSASEASAAAANGAVGAAAVAGGGPASSAESVEVEEGAGCLFVKVHCRDRHGLLSDIVRTLKSIPVEITTAAITTTHSGNVYDVFQVTPAPGTPTALKEEIIAGVHGVMASATVEKKRRAE